MIITAFRNYNAYNIFFLLLLTFFLRIALLLDPSPDLTYWFPFGLVSDQRANISITAVIVFFQAILLNRSITRHNLFNKTSYLPALMYVVLASMFSSFLAFSPLLICNFFLLWLMDRIFFLYRGANVLRIAFDMGLIVGGGSLFYYPFLLLFPGIWYSLILFRSFSWREWVAPLAGMTIPYIFAFTYYMYTDSASSFLDIWQPIIVHLPVLSTILSNDYLALLPLLFLLGLSFNKMRATYFKNVVLVRKSQQSLLLLSVLIIAAFLLSPQRQVAHFMMLAVPFSVFLAYYFVTARVKWFYESLFALLLGSIFYFQFV